MSDVSARVKELQQRGVRIVACTFVDLAGVTRVKCVPIGRLDRAAAHGVGISDLSAIYAIDDHITTTSVYDSPSGDMRLRPDVSAAVALHFADGWAWAPVDQYSQEGEHKPDCPRGFTQRAAAAAQRRGLGVRMAYEVEFTLLDAAGEPAHRGPGYGMRALTAHESLAMELVTALSAQGIEVEQFHPEYAPGQFEVSVTPLDPVAACDRLVLLRNTITRVAGRHDLTANFSPIVLPGEVGNGCHAHVSFSRDGANVLTGGDRPAGLTADGESLLAGILNRLPDMQAVLAPSVQSYERLQPQHWSGSFTAWGVENREAALRFCPGSASLRSTGANAEIKPIDGTANPYLVAGLLIMSALAGLASEEELPPPVRVDPATMSEADREAGQIYRLPPDLAAAIERAERSAFLSAAFGKQLFDDVVAVRRFELEHYGDAESDVLLDLGRRYG